MTQTRLIMGMPITVSVANKNAREPSLQNVFSYFQHVDEVFSTYKRESEISRINRGELSADDASPEVREVLALAERTKWETFGYFNIKTPDGKLDPSGLVKGWAIRNAAQLLAEEGFKDYYVDAGGDIQTRGNASKKEPWKVGIRNPFNGKQIVKVLTVAEKGVATSGTYCRGQHVYNPYAPGLALSDVVSLTVVASNVYEADRFATAAFAMGKEGIYFLERLAGIEGYSIDRYGIATQTSGFEQYVHHA